MQTNAPNQAIAGRAGCPHPAALVANGRATGALGQTRPTNLDGDQVFGQWSDVGSIAVTG